jgi:hypothetical protein
MSADIQEANSTPQTERPRIAKLKAPFGDAFWFFHQRAVRLQDQLEQEGAR